MVDLMDPATWKMFKDGISSLKDIVDIGKTVRDATKDENTKQTLSASIEKAEEALAIGRAQVAKALGYHLCQCSFPPQVMLSKGHHERWNKEVFVCSACGKQEPSRHYFDNLDQTARENDDDPSWIKARY